MELWRPVIDALMIIVPSLAGAVLAAGFIVLATAGDNAYRLGLAQDMISRAIVGLLISGLAIAAYELLVRCVGPSCS